MDKQIQIRIELFINGNIYSNNNTVHTITGNISFNIKKY